MGKNCKTIVLTSGSEEGFNWMLKVDIYKNSANFSGRFELASPERKRRYYVRSKDRHWAENTFPRRFGQKYEASRMG